MYLSFSVRFLSAGKLVFRGSSGVVFHPSPWFGQFGRSRPSVIRSSPDIRMVVGRSLRTSAEILLLGTWLLVSPSMSFVTQNSTPATGVTVLEFPRHTFGALPSGKLVILSPSLSAKPSETRVLVQPVSQTARTVEPGRSHCLGASSFWAHVWTFNILRSFWAGSLVWKHWPLWLRFPAFWWLCPWDARRAVVCTSFGRTRIAGPGVVNRWLVPGCGVFRGGSSAVLIMALSELGRHARDRLPGWLPYSLLVVGQTSATWPAVSHVAQRNISGSTVHSRLR